MRILLYQAQQNAIGGIETFNFNFCKRLSKYYDITFVCDICDPVQFNRLSKYVRVIIYDGQQFETDVCVFSSAWGIRPEDHIKAKRYIQMVHADFDGIKEHWNFEYKKLNKVTEHWGGGENICKTFKRRYGWDCKRVHYLLDNETKPQQVLHLITVSRVAKEKGFQRVVDMARALKNSGRKFNWDIWGDGFNQSYVDGIQRQLKDIPEVSFRGRHYDLESYIADADYLVQLSDTEGYCFAMYEALSLNTPVIATDFPNAREQITEGENGYILKMNLSNLDIKKLYTKIPQFQFKELATEDEWIKLLGKPKGRAKTKIIEKNKFRVMTIRPYFDIQRQMRFAKGVLMEVTKERRDLLFTRGIVKVIPDRN